MRIVSYVMAFAAVILLTLTPAAAAEKKTVPANKTTGVGFIYYSTGLGDNCQNSGRGKYSVSKDAQHGKIHMEWRKLKADFQRGCKNTTMGGLAIWYTPNKGYHGEDSFTVRMTVPGLYAGNTFNEGRSWKFKITVE